jgi:hypothetical protein
MQLNYEVDLGVIGKVIAAVTFAYHTADPSVGVKDEIEVVDVSCGLLSSSGEMTLFKALQYDQKLDFACREFMTSAEL